MFSIFWSCLSSEEVTSDESVDPNLAEVKQEVESGDVVEEPKKQGKKEKKEKRSKKEKKEKSPGLKKTKRDKIKEKFAKSKKDRTKDVEAPQVNQDTPTPTSSVPVDNEATTQQTGEQQESQANTDNTAQDSL